MTYEMHERTYRDTYNRRCIDGSITGCGKCVGYCEFADHPGYLTKEMRREHNCIKKGCHYYRQKEKHTVDRTVTPSPAPILDIAQAETEALEGLKAIRAEKGGNGWVIYCVAIADYALEAIADRIRKRSGEEVRLVILPYRFDIATKLIFGV